LAEKSVELSASLEDYLEAIFNILNHQQVARSKDIAKLLDVAKPSVTGALKVLAKKGLVNYKPYGYVTLTTSGTAQAMRVSNKHHIINSFFVDILGVEPDTASKAACKAEHALGTDVVSKLSEFTKFLNEISGEDKCLADKLRGFKKRKIKSISKHY